MNTNYTHQHFIRHTLLKRIKQIKTYKNDKKHAIKLLKLEIKTKNIKKNEFKISKDLGLVIC